MLTYTIGKGKYKNWIIGEREFDVQHQGKGESIFCLGNGYMGIRSAFEEPYPFQVRGLFVGGCFNRNQNETVELPNGADNCELLLTLDGEFFSMDSGEVSDYSRYLNLYTGELVRKLQWKSPKGRRYHLVFRRTVSRTDLHAYGMRVEISSLDADVILQVVSGINARMTNSGVQHFHDGTKKVLERKFLYLDQTTTQSNVTLYHCCGTKVSHAEEKREFSMQRRRIQETVTAQIKKGEEVCFEKLAVLYTSRELAEQDEQQSRNLIFSHIESLVKEGYETLLEKSAAVFQEYWEHHDVQIKSSVDKIQLALRFAQYHLLAMIPRDSHSSIAAKGLTGEGYKGHVFWDTEVFILPYYLFNLPDKARQLLEYRINRSEQAEENARKKGYQGMMYPWESAETGMEETPLFASMDILTGKAAQVWSGIKEHHITADIAYAVWMYKNATGDRDFMKSGGNFLIVGAAVFWMSRSIYIEEKQRFEIHDIIGPDEYTEHVNNNAYSNYMAYYVAEKAVRILENSTDQLKQKTEEYYGETDLLNKLKNYIRKLYLPEVSENHDGVIPQDDTFLDKKILDISRYRNDNVKQTILKEYGREQVNDMQVLKQSDVIMLMELIPELFDNEVKIKNWDYYEPKTIHDSSLSRAIYSIVASDCKKADKAYESFLHAIDIDMGMNPCSSDEGIHAASMGGIWLSVVRGFAGVYLQDDCLCINPCLPEAIQEVRFCIIYRQKTIEIRVTKDHIYLKSRDLMEITVKIRNEKYQFTKYMDYADPRKCVS